MDPQRGRTNRRRFLLIAGIPLLGLAGGTAYALKPPPPYRHRVRTDLDPLNTRLRPYLGDLAEAHWVGYDVDGPAEDRGIPGPDSRIRLVGVARLAAGGAEAIVSNPEYDFAPGAAPTGLPEPLAPHLPAGAAWRHSPKFDAYANPPGARPQVSGRFSFDTARNLVCFDLLYLYT
ncbi:hypothetical protein ACIGD1_10945 [Streptomyces sp. NPDC085612]|uniref:hypothetical protein n=1 Tax=Streptomyces sp. NPDC085612 TaxID=3365732 RepID=UPI0037CF64D0